MFLMEFLFETSFKSSSQSITHKSNLRILLNVHLKLHLMIKRVNSWNRHQLQTQHLFTIPWELDLCFCYQVGITLMCTSTRVTLKEFIQREKDLSCLLSFKEYGFSSVTQISLKIQLFMEEYLQASLKQTFKFITANFMKTLECSGEFSDKVWMEGYSFKEPKYFLIWHFQV